MRTENPGEYVSVESAGNIAGISSRTLRYWVTTGKLPAIAGKRGKLVKLADVQALAELTGKTPATTRQVAGNDGNAATSADWVAGNVSDETAVTPAAIDQLEAIRDQWLQPLIGQIRQLERERGRLEEQRDAAIAGKAVADSTIAELRAEVQLLREIRHIDRAEDDTDPIPIVSPSDAPGREQNPHGPETHGHRESWLVTGVRRLFGRS